MVTTAQLKEQLARSLKEKNEVETSTLRMLLARLTVLEKSGSEQVAESQMEQVIISELKKRKEAAEQFKAAGRMELAEKELAEAEILQAFLPPQLSREELEDKVVSFLASGGYNIKDMGLVIKAMKEQLGSSVDGALLAQVVKLKLQNQS